MNLARLLPTAVLVVTVVASGLSFSRNAAAQGLNPRFGVGANAMVSSADGFGIGLVGRASFPINADLSFAAGAGLTGFVLGGRREADYIFDPQASAIVTLPASRSRLAYLLFGVGAYVPFGGDGEGDAVSGPTLHGGIGWVRALQESSLFYEIDPALIIGEDHVDVAVPVRVGIIF